MSNEGMIVFLCQEEDKDLQVASEGRLSHWQKPGFLTPLQCLTQVNVVLWGTTCDSVNGTGLQ